MRDGLEHWEGLGGECILPSKAMIGLQKEEEIGKLHPSKFQIGSFATSSDDGLSTPSTNDSSMSNSPSVHAEGDTRDESLWHCDFQNCRRVFQKRHDLNRHKKYHFKPFKCLKPACLADKVAFSLAKDLTRHQKSHGGERYFCPYIGCTSTTGGSFTGFTRIDNWRRHMRKHTGKCDI